MLQSSQKNVFQNHNTQVVPVRLLPLTGRFPGKLCNVTVTLAGREFQRKAVAQPGADLGWTVCLSLPYKDRDDRDFVTALMDQKYESPPETIQYTPPEVKEGIITTLQMVGEFDTTIVDAGTSNVGSNTTGTESSRIECTEESVADNTESVTENVEDITVGKVEEESVEDAELDLGIDTLTSVNDEAEGVITGRSADREGECY